MKRDGRLARRWIATGRLAAAMAAVLFLQTAVGDTLTEKATETVLRRARLMERAGSGLVVLISGETKNFSNDVDYPFRQENNLFYLTGINQVGIALALRPGAQEPREVLFLPRRDPSRERWTGRMLSVEEARRLSGIWDIRETGEWESFLDAALSGKDHEKRLSSSEEHTRVDNAAADSSDLWLILGNGTALAPLFRRERVFADTLAARHPRIRRKDLYPLFRDLRIVKSAYEIGRLRKAIDITCEAHQGVMQKIRPGINESELDGFIHSVFRKHGAQWGFPSIVGSGPNATTLHYEQNDRWIEDGEMVLMDIGAEVDHYSADVTRTIPAGGRFTQEQKTLYEIVLAAQEAAFSAIRPGATIREVHNAALTTLKAGLLRVGLVADTTGNQYRMWFMHGTSHWLGLDVHDPGTRDTIFAPGMVLTVEPGLYIREDALDYLEKTSGNEKLLQTIRPAFERYKNIGIRIEDDVLVTQEGYELLSGSAPRTVEAIEMLMGR
ncbi:MAG: aminopeptidase P family protein [candidate division Zixibacteria bacterium]|nr:aminopeptidase P family protein [candidate division Zixibacteria bacterium]